MGVSPASSRATPDPVSWHLHPQLRELFGATSSSAVWTVALASALLLLGVWVAGRPTWVMVAVSITAGAASIFEHATARVTSTALSVSTHT